MNFKSRFKRGSITLITAAVSVVLVGMVALVTDVGYMYFEQAKLQSATNAAWKAGYDKLAELRQENKVIGEDDEVIVKNHMLEVMRVNGYADLSDEQLKILLTNNRTNLKIEATDEVGLFFMKVFDVKTANVYASRQGAADGAKILPVAIPHGEVHDLSWLTYEWLPFGDTDGFKPNTEYIIKLGEAEQDEALGDEDYMIYIPTGLDGIQSDARAYRLAYGAIFWALQIDEEDEGALVPAFWLLSDNGGGFLMRAGASLEYRLESGDYRGVNFRRCSPTQICDLLRVVGVNITNKNEINVYLSNLIQGKITNDRIVPLVSRPKIAVYSSQANPDPVEHILRNAKIPYGTYGLPGGWPRTENYNKSKNTKIFDIEILAGALADYDWLHLHHEDFTGLTWADGGAYIGATGFGGRINPNGKLGVPTDCRKMVAHCVKKSYPAANSEDKLRQMACYKCRQHMVIKAHKDGNGNISYYYLSRWAKNVTEMVAMCKTAVTTRCGNCGYFDLNRLDDQENFWGCKFYNYLVENYGDIGDDDVSLKEDRCYFSSNDFGLSLEQLMQKWFSEATIYQKMKWKVAETVKQHILDGGFMYTQCFAAETLDLALSQAAYYRTRSLQQSYDACIAFTDFRYTDKPAWNCYSSIDVTGAYGSAPIVDEFRFSPLCQVVGEPSSTRGATSGFHDPTIKSGIDKMFGFYSDPDHKYAWKYIGGQLLGSDGQKHGHFAMLGGHNTNNTDGDRLILNNILLGSTSEKETSLGARPKGKTKYQYGCIDPDNDGNKTSTDFLGRLLFGFDTPINFADVISTDNSKYTDESSEASGLITGQVQLATYTPNSIVIVPIVGTPQSVKSYQKSIQNNYDEEVLEDNITIYDIKVGANNNNAADFDELEGNYHPGDVGIDNLKNSVQVIGFAKFRILPVSEYTRSDVLGKPMMGQIRGEFIEYIVDPREVAALLASYNG